MELDIKTFTNHVRKRELNLESVRSEQKLTFHKVNVRNSSQERILQDINKMLGMWMSIHSYRAGRYIERV